MMQDLAEDSPRRTWLQRTLAGAVSLTLVAVFYPVARFLRPRVATASGALDVVAPFRVNQLPAAPGNPFEVGGKPCLVVLTAEGARRQARGEQLRSEDLHAFNAICTHVDCTVRFRPEEGDIFCSCHDGVYDLNGHNVSGPPPRPLEAYRVTLRGELGQEEIVVSRQT
jgi:Rieske Fe-S protein